MNLIIQALIIDDEKPAREIIRNYLESVPEVRVIGEYENGFEGAKAINELKPGLVFLDIQMPKINGFELLEIIDHRPEIIFITAYNQYAIQAFEMNAVDYLLKPISRERFTVAIAKVLSRKHGGETTPGEVQKLVRHNQASGELLERVVIRSGSKIHVIPCDRIDYIEAQDDYVMIYTGDGKYLKQSTMKYFEDKLDPRLFARVHRSYIVQVDRIERIELYGRETYMLFLKTGSKITVSKAGYDKLRQMLSF